MNPGIGQVYLNSMSAVDGANTSKLDLAVVVNEVLDERRDDDGPTKKVDQYILFKF